MEIINSDQESHHYGSVAPDEFTEYKRFQTAYPREHVNIYVNSVFYEFPPDDSVRVLLQEGKFTYELTLDTVANTLNIHVTADAGLDDK